MENAGPSFLGILLGALFIGHVLRAGFDWLFGRKGGDPWSAASVATSTGIGLVVAFGIALAFR